MCTFVPLSLCVCIPLLECKVTLQPHARPFVFSTDRQCSSDLTSSLEFALFNSRIKNMTIIYNTRFCFDQYFLRYKLKIQCSKYIFFIFFLGDGTFKMFPWTLFIIILVFVHRKYLLFRSLTHKVQINIDTDLSPTTYLKKTLFV